MSMVLRAESNGIATQGPPRPANQNNSAVAAMFQLNEIWEMAEAVAASRLFPNVNSPQAAFTLMMICTADGLHPIQAIRRFHIVEGRPSMRADAIQAEFQARGGRIEILRCDAEEARAIFSHPLYQPKGFEMAVTFEQFRKSGAINGKDGIKKNWRESPADMLWARLVTKGIRRIDPGVVVGLSSSEEMADILASEQEAMSARATLATDVASSRYTDPVVPGFAGMGWDDRSYLELVTTSTNAVNGDLKSRVDETLGGGEEPVAVVVANDLHKHLMLRAINLGYDNGQPPAKLGEAIKRLTAVYKAEREWIRNEINAYLFDAQKKVEEQIQLGLEARQLTEGEDAQDVIEVEAEEAGDDLETTEAGARG